MSSNGSTDGRLDRLTTAVEGLASVVTTQGEQMTVLVSVVRQQSEETQRGFQVLTAQMLAHEGRLASLEASMTEVLARLRIIGEAVATHSHEEQ